MRYLLFSFVLLACGCSSSSTGTHISPTYKKFSESVKLSSIQNVNTEINKIIAFLERTNEVGPRSTFVIYYQPTTSVSMFVAKLKEQVEFDKFELSRIKFNPVSNRKTDYVVKVTSKYFETYDSDCKYLKFSTRNDYEFSCVIDYNRKNSFVVKNPTKPI